MIVASEPAPRLDLSQGLLTREQIAELLAIAPTTVAELARRTNDPIPSVKIGRRRRYSLRAVEAWVQQQEG